MDRWALICVNEQFDMSVKTGELEDLKKELVKEFNKEVAEQDSAEYVEYQPGVQLRGTYFERGEIYPDAMRADLIISEGEFESHWGIREIINNFK